MHSRNLLPAAILLCAFASAVSAQASPARAYYQDGKRIPAPAQAPPVYPERELRRRIGGTTVVAFHFDENGKVTFASVKSSSGNKNLDSAAVASVLKWKVTVPTKDGVPAAGDSESPITFSPSG